MSTQPSLRLRPETLATSRRLVRYILAAALGLPVEVGLRLAFRVARFTIALRISWAHPPRCRPLNSEPRAGDDRGSGLTTFTGEVGGVTPVARHQATAGCVSLQLVSACIEDAAGRRSSCANARRALRLPAQTAIDLVRGDEIAMVDPHPPPRLHPFIVAP